MYKEIFSRYSGKFDFLEFCVLKNESKSFHLKDGKEDGFQSGLSEELFARAYKNGRKISFRVGGGEASAIVSALEDASDTVGLMPVDKDLLTVVWSDDVIKTQNSLLLFDDDYNKITSEALSDAALSAFKSASETNKKVRDVKQIEISAGVTKTGLINSLSPYVEKSETWFSALAYCIADFEDEQEEGFEYDSSVYFDELDFSLIGKTSAENAAGLIGAKPLKTGKYNIIFENSVSADFLELVFELVSGESVYRKKSMLEGKLGEKVASDIFTIVDNPLLKKGKGSFAFDDEGSQAVVTEVFTDGVLKSFLHNTYTSSILGMKNTANASRDSGGNIDVSHSNFILKPTDGNFNFNGIGKTIIVTDVMGMHTANPVSGDFSVGISGFVMENGIKKTPFRESILSGNIKEILENCVHIFNNTRSFGGIVTGDVFIGEFTVSGS